MGFVDDLRGVAVVFMILWHTLDGWLLPGLDSGPGYETLRLLGGLAAPLFVLLAGVGAGMKYASDAERGRPVEETRRGLVSRGLVILVLGYALRLQMWMLDSFAIRHLWAAQVWVPLLAGLVCGGLGFRRLARPDGRAAGLVAAGAALFAVGVYQVYQVVPSRAVGLLRVDVLQCIGASLAIVASVGPAVGAFARPGRAVLLGLAVALATPALAAWVPGPLPAPIAGYLARWATAPGTAPVAMFPLFPWLAYAWIGVAVGTVWHRRRARIAEALLVTVVLAALTGALTSEASPQVHRWATEAPWLAQALRVTYRTSLGLVLAGVVKLLLDRAPQNPLRTMGQASLLLYWVHLELAYGVASRPISGRLGYGAWLLGFAALTVAMGALALARRGPIERYLRQRAESAPRPSGISS